MKTWIQITLLALGFGCSNARAQTEATFYTSMGSFKVELTDTLTPVTVDSFIARVSEGFYDGLTFHRVIDGFMIQGGDPAGNGSGNAGYTIPDEFHPNLKNVPKALAMANAGPNTGSCQFYINLVTNSHLNNKHTVFGMVTTGFPIVQDIGNVATDANDKPLTAVTIDSIRITKFAVSIKEAIGNGGVLIYPNPAGGRARISLPGIATKIEVINTEGKLVYSTMADKTAEIDLEHQPPGVYIVRITNSSGITEQKLVVQ